MISDDVDPKRFMQACREVCESFEKREDTIVKVLIAAALTDGVPKDLRLELLERGLNLFKLECFYVTFAANYKLFLADTDDQRKAALASYAKGVMKIIDAKDKLAERFAVSVEAARDYAKQQAPPAASHQ